MKNRSLKCALYVRHSNGIAARRTGVAGPDARPKERAAVYVKGHDLFSLKRQQNACSRLGGPNDGKPPVYSDLPPSRAGLARLMRDAAARKFDCVVVESLDRFSRDILALSKITRKLESYGVRVQNADGSCAAAIESAVSTTTRRRRPKRKPGN